MISIHLGSAERALNKLYGRRLHYGYDLNIRYNNVLMKKCIIDENMTSMTSFDIHDIMICYHVFMSSY